METGDEWIYRLKEDSMSERVRILTVNADKRKRVDVEFMDGAKGGQIFSSPQGRLKAAWSEVAKYDQMQRNWLSIRSPETSDTEDTALYVTFDLLIPTEVAELLWSPVRRAASILDIPKLERLISSPIATISDRVRTFWDDDRLTVSVEGSLLLAQLACQTNAEPILDWVVAEEMKQQELVTNGEVFTSTVDGEEYQYSPQQKYRHYLAYYRPLYELLRQWCGYRAVTAQERVDAAEAEVGRLNDLIAELIDDAQSRGNGVYADHMKERFHSERITISNIRPDINRPLEIHEWPVRYVERKRSWPR